MADYVTTMQGAGSVFAVLGQLVVVLADTAVKEIALAVDKEVVEATPVDTGMARSNWLVSYGFEDFREIHSYVPYPKYSGPKLGETANADAAKSQAIQALNGYKSGDTIYVVNNLDYVSLMNDGAAGHVAPQSPAGFVESGVVAGVERGLVAAFTKAGII